MRRDGRLDRNGAIETESRFFLLLRAVLPSASMPTHLRRRLPFGIGGRSETLAERELRGVFFDKSSFRLCAEELVLEPAELLFDFFETRVRSENEINQLVSACFV